MSSVKQGNQKQVVETHSELQARSRVNDLVPNCPAEETSQRISDDDDPSGYSSGPRKALSSEKRAENSNDPEPIQMKSDEEDVALASDSSISSSKKGSESDTTLPLLCMPDSPAPIASPQAVPQPVIASPPLAAFKLPASTAQIESNYDEVTDSFDFMALKSELQRGIYAYGFERPFAIQQRAMMQVIKGSDVIVHAQLGTEKTATFSISVLQKLDPNVKACQTLILAPLASLPSKSRKWLSPSVTS